MGMSLGDIIFLSILTVLSVIGIIFNIGVLVIYLKNGHFDLLKIFKIILLVICIYLSITHLCLGLIFSYLNWPICKALAESKQLWELALNTIQVTLLFIIYISFNNQRFLDKHPISFKVIVNCIALLPIVLTFIINSIFFFSETVYDPIFCIRLQIQYYSPFFIFLIIYSIAFIILICKLYSSLNKYEQTGEHVKIYKQHLRNYIYGFGFSFPYFLLSVATLFFSAIIEFISGENTLIIILFTIVFYCIIILSPTCIAYIYCFNKEHWKQLKSMLCCKKEKEGYKDENVISFISMNEKDNDNTE